jgi:hypothetical protein
VASEKVTGEAWHTVRQDCLLVLDPNDLEEPHAERLLGDRVVGQADIDPLKAGPELRGKARGDFAAERSARLMAGRG